MDRFAGDIDDLERARGIYLLGLQMGWRVLVIIHTKHIIRKYEEILGIQIRSLWGSRPDGHPLSGL